MIKAYPLAPFPRKGVPEVQPREAQLPFTDLPPPWGGRAEAA